MILLDWTKPASMVCIAVVLVKVQKEADRQIKELLYWLSWITDWAESSIDRGKAEEMRDKR